MDKDRIREEIEEQASVICCKYNAYATNLPETVVDWMTDRFMDDYSEEEYTDRFPDECDVIKYLCCYIQENC